MTLTELIERLESCREKSGGDSEVRLMATAPPPIVYRACAIAGVASGDAIKAVENDQDRDDDDVIYICEGQELGYGTKRAWEVCQ